METVLHKPTGKEQSEARKAFEELGTSKKEAHTVQVTIDGRTVSLPQSTAHFITEMLEAMAEGKSISLLSLDSEISTQQAAELLNVSRPHVVKLLEDGEIPYRMVGTHRRVKTKNVLAYKNAQEKQQTKALKKLTGQAQELDMGY